MSPRRRQGPRPGGAPASGAPRSAPVATGPAATCRRWAGAHSSTDVGELARITPQRRPAERTTIVARKYRMRGDTAPEPVQRLALRRGECQTTLTRFASRLYLSGYHPVRTRTTVLTSAPVHRPLVLKRTPWPKNVT